MSPSTYLVFGDLHGRVLPAFRIALAWQREHGEPLAGLLQVGDLGYFPDLTRLDKATRRHAERDPLELGVQQVVSRNPQADALFGEPDLPEGLWFTAGNHEDHEILESLVHGAGSSPHDFPVDYYHRVRCIRDGRASPLPGGLRVGAVWGIDGEAPNARRKAPGRARLRARSASELAGASFHVLLTHESPRDAVLPDSGSADLSALLGRARPAFHFFGHYKGPGARVEGDFGPTRVYHLRGLEFRGRGETAEEGSVGVLRWAGAGGEFTYVDGAWLRTVNRRNWARR